MTGEDVSRVEIEIFDVAYHIIGGGEEGDKTLVGTKEEADHSLPYLVAVAILDGQVMPDQYRPDRIRKEDVQSLLKKVVIKPSAEYSRKFPDEMPCRVTLTIRDGRKVKKEKRDYEGFQTRPMSWETAVEKFEILSAPYGDRSLCQEIIRAVSRLESIEVSDLTELLGRVRASSV